MKHSLIILLALALISLGCSGNEKAATRDNSSAQPTSSSASAGSNAATSNTGSSNSDQTFLQDAIKGNRAEVTLGKMVAAKTKDPSVKQFAQMMVKDHTVALSQLQQLAQQKNITVPEGLPDDAKELQSKLQSDTGKQFDKDYMDAMVQDHQKDVQDFQNASQNAKDPDVKQIASKLTPTLEHHLQKAQQIDQKLGGSASSSSGL
jgi:putative membrane protein